MTPISLEAQFGEIASYIALVIEAGALIAVTLALQASLSVLAIATKAAPVRSRAARSGSDFATWILLGLEFALAADLVRTALPPTWEDISKLA